MNSWGSFSWSHPAHGSSGGSLWVWGDRFSPYLCLIVLSIKFIGISPLQRTHRRFKKQKKKKWSFSGNAGQVLVIMLERKRNYSEVSHQTLEGLVQSAETAGEECGQEFWFRKKVLKKTVHAQKWWDALTRADLLIPASWSFRRALSRAALNEWMKNNGRASGAPGNGSASL